MLLVETTLSPSSETPQMEPRCISDFNRNSWTENPILKGCKQKVVFFSEIVKFKTGVPPPHIFPVLKSLK